MALMKLLLSAEKAALVISIILCLAVLAYSLHKHSTRAGQIASDFVPISVNYHYTRECNKECGFCFHTAKTSHVASLDEAKRGLALLKRAGMKKLNFAGGEPFLHPKHLGQSSDPQKESLKGTMAD